MKVELERPEFPMELGQHSVESMPPTAVAYEVHPTEHCEVCDSGWGSERTLPWPLCRPHFDVMATGERFLAGLRVNGGPSDHDA